MKTSINNWTISDLKDQEDKCFLVTGVNTRIGFETCLELARKKARLIMAGKNPDKLQKAHDKIMVMSRNMQITTWFVDLGDIGSIKNFAENLRTEYYHIDGLINNTEAMLPPPGKTINGFETQFGVNYIGQYVLTALLFPLLKDTQDSRIVTVSSLADINGILDFENFKLEKPFDKFREYGQSKVADLIFTLELQRRIEKMGLNMRSLAAHPGVSRTELQRTDVPEMIEGFDYMSKSQGALASLYAATENIIGGSYIGPNGHDEVTPAAALISDYVQDKEIGKLLWEYTEKETGIEFDFN